MKRARVIPVLLLQNEGLVKTFRFDNGKYIGDPINAVKIFNDKQCDELIFLDISASKSGGEINYKTIENIASECFMPLAYGGGIKSCSQIEKLLKLGVEKVVLNSVLLENPTFLSEAIKQFGSSTIVVSVDLKKNIWGKYGIYSHISAKIDSRKTEDYFEWINNLNPGEVMINMVDLDGTMKGYDFVQADRICNIFDMPLIFCGGCKDFNDIQNLLQNTNVSAAAVGSFFVYHGPHRGVLINYPNSNDITEIYK